MVIQRVSSKPAARARPHDEPGERCAVKQLTEPERKELLLKCWMTHDAMWFFHTQQVCGMDTANQLNLAAIASMAPIEAKRVRKALGFGEISSLAELQEFTDGMFQVVKGDFMDFSFRFTPEGILRMDMGSCFAHQGMVNMGLIDQYQCGIFHRVEGWFTALGLAYRVSPEISGCMLHEQGQCYREYEFSFAD
jgi:uncharacterized protein DUF6125